MYCKNHLLQLFCCMLLAAAATNVATAQTQLIKSLKIDNGGSSTTTALWLKTPFSGSILTDSLLTWNSADSSVRKIPVSTLGNSFWQQNGNNWGSATQPGVLGLLSSAANKNLNIQSDSVTVVASTDSVNGFTKLNVRGPVTNTAAYNAGSTPAVIDFTKSNLAYTSTGGEQGTYTLNGLKDGGTYTLALQGTGSGATSFASGDNAALKFYPANGNGSTLLNTQTLFTFIVMGNAVYYWMTTGIATTPTNP